MDYTLSRGDLERKLLEWGARDPKQPTDLDLIKLELRDLLASVGEVRMGWNAVMTRIAAMEERLRKVEERPSVGIGGEWVAPDTKPLPPEERDALTWNGGIQGIPGVVTISAPPEFRDWMNEELE